MEVPPGTVGTGSQEPHQQGREVQEHVWGSLLCGSHWDWPGQEEKEVESSGFSPVWGYEACHLCVWWATFDLYSGLNHKTQKKSNILTRSSQTVATQHRSSRRSWHKNQLNFDWITDFSLPSAGDGTWPMAQRENGHIWRRSWSN